MTRLATFVDVGPSTPPSQQHRLYARDVSPEDVVVLRKAALAVGSAGSVELRTNHGLWTFVVRGCDNLLNPTYFDLISTGGPSPLPSDG